MKHMHADSTSVIFNGIENILLLKSYAFIAAIIIRR